MSEAPPSHPPHPPRPSPFAQCERDRGARFGEVGGWLVPRDYGEREGRQAARASAALVDLVPTGRIKVTGKDRVSLLQRISTNDLAPLEAGRLAPTLFVTPKGRIVARALVLNRGDSLLLVTSSGGGARLQDWIRRYVFADDFKMTDVSREAAAFAIVGPRAGEIVKRLTGVGPGAFDQDRFLGLPVEDIETLIAPYDALPQAWLVLAELPGILAVFKRALAEGEALGLALIGSDEAEVLRVEAGISGDGHELTEEWNPWEARLEGSFSLSKGCYTGQEVIARLNTYDKVQRHLVGVRMGAIVPPAVPQKLYDVPGEGGSAGGGHGAGGEGGSVDGGHDADGERGRVGDADPARAGASGKEIGTLTSAVCSEQFGETIGLAFVRQAYEAPGTAIAVGQERFAASVCALPFAER